MRRSAWANFPAGFIPGLAAERVTGIPSNQTRRMRCHSDVRPIAGSYLREMAGALTLSWVALDPRPIKRSVGVVLTPHRLSGYRDRNRILRPASQANL
jgi:hypothetical protein